MKKLLLIATLITSVAHADVLQDFDSLGGNKILLKQAQELSPEKKITVVQERIVGRRKRSEFYPEFARVVGGNAYMNSQMIGLNYQFHITPRWSVGAKYDFFDNDLSAEGERLINKEGLIPDVDAPSSQYLAQVNWYPIYGKMNLLDMGVVHFDIYLLGAYGQVQLESGNKGTWQAGGGIGFWISQHLTSRFETRYQTYEAQNVSGVKALDLTVLSLSLGYML